jgi:hypothetical protein
MFLFILYVILNFVSYFELASRLFCHILTYTDIMRCIHRLFNNVFHFLLRIHVLGLNISPLTDNHDKVFTLIKINTYVVNFLVQNL